ncbi:DUF2321 domain-containing protein [Candidatus Binatus sp.]|uniref:DUF2321 domain-containing protein n=1 Tax=Candidatus Binatus sp. TaxID=2811406 RepID=UPI003BB1F799
MSDDEQEERRDIAQICLTGHVINPSFRLRPQFNTNFCETCGRATTNHCGSCKAPIPGAMPLIAMSKQKYLKAYCGNCGTAYPWTRLAIDETRKLAIETVELSDDERNALVESVPSLFREGPGTPVAIARFQRITLKGSRKLLSDGLKHILYTLAAEGARRQIGGP